MKGVIGGSTTEQQPGDHNWHDSGCYPFEGVSLEKTSPHQRNEPEVGENIFHSQEMIDRWPSGYTSKKKEKVMCENAQSNDKKNRTTRKKETNQGLQCFERDGFALRLGLRSMQSYTNDRVWFQILGISLKIPVSCYQKCPKGQKSQA